MQYPQFEAHASLEDRHWWFTARRAILGGVLHALLPKHALILDVGCGTGGITHALSDEYRVIGIDPDPHAIRFAKQKYPSLTFIEGRVPDDAKDLKKADAVLLMDVLEHVEDDVTFVHRIIDHLKPGALLIMMAPADPSLWSPHDAAFEHYRRYTMETFKKLWAGASVDALAVTHLNHHLHPLVKLQRALNRLRKKSSGIGGTDISLPPAFINSLLHRIFAGEGKRVLAMLKHSKTSGYSRGVSVFCVLRKKQPSPTLRGFPP